MAAPSALPPDLVLTFDAPPLPGFGEQLGESINDFMAETVPGALHRFAVRLNDGDVVLVAGLSGRMAWDWLFVAALWVHRDRRGQGAGRALLAAAERHAAAAGCHSVWLDTFQAGGFYEKLGYTVFGALEDYPKSQTRYFMRKRLG